MIIEPTRNNTVANGKKDNTPDIPIIGSIENPQLAQPAEAILNMLAEPNKSFMEVPFCFMILINFKIRTRLTPIRIETRTKSERSNGENTLWPLFKRVNKIVALYEKVSFPKIVEYTKR